MDIRFVLPELRRMDDLKCEAIAVPLFVDERPLRGPGGLLDWRLSGMLSQLILRGRVSGNAQETVLIPARPKLPFEKLFLFGLGPMESFDGTLFDATVDRMLDTLTAVRVRASVIVLPGRAVERISAVEAMERFLEVAGRHPEHDEITLVESAEAQKAMGPIVEKARRRARAAFT